MADLPLLATPSWCKSIKVHLSKESDYSKELEHLKEPEDLLAQANFQERWLARGLSTKLV